MVLLTSWMFAMVSVRHCRGPVIVIRQKEEEAAVSMP